MTASIQTRQQMTREVHQTLESILPKLDDAEVTVLLQELRRLSPWPRLLLRIIALATDMAAVSSDTMAFERGTSRDAQSPHRALHFQGGGHGALLTARDGQDQLDTVSEVVAPEDWAQSPVLGPTQLLESLSIARSTLDNWRRQGHVIALRKGLRNHVYPTRQFKGNAPLKGIAEVLAAFDGDPEAAWEWLIAPETVLSDERPLQLLEQGQTQKVVNAAQSVLDYA